MARRRFHTLALMSISSGMPYGVVVGGMLQAFLRSLGVSLTSIGWLSWVSFPWNFKFLWSPVVDRYAIRWPGRRRSWVLISQFALAAGLVLFAFLTFQGVQGGFSARQLWLVGALGVFVAFWGATQDIALDAYAVEFLRPDEQAEASGLRVMYWRLGWLLVSGLGIALADSRVWKWLGVQTEPNAPWPWIFVGAAAAFLALLPITLVAKEPEIPAAPPRTLMSAVVEPFISYFRRPQAVWFALFLVFYKFGDNLSLSMWVPFMIDKGVTLAEIGLLNKTLGTVCLIAGATLGGKATPKMGLGRALWIFGLVQGVSSLLFAMASLAGGARWAVYLAIAGENVSVGLGTAAQGTLILRLCEKRFGATQFALLSSLFAIGRFLTGPIAGTTAERYGYTTLFIAGALAALPGLALLQVIAPVQQREVPAALPQPEAAQA